MSSKKPAEERKWDPIYEPLMAHLLSTSEIKIKRAIEVGQKSVEFCRGTDLLKWVVRHEESLRNKFPSCFSDPSVPLTNKEAHVLCGSLSRFGFMYKAQHKPIAATKTGDAAAAVESTSPKWPKRLEMTADQQFDPSFFYIIHYEPPSHWPHIYLALIIGAVLIVCLFPAWPLALKLCSWYLSVCMMTFILGSVVLRLILFLAFWFFGIDFWFFPNLFDEDRGVVDSFRPVYIYEKRNDDWGMVAARCFLAVLLAGASYQLSQTHSLGDVHKFAAQQFLDVLDWGHQKLAAPAESSVPVLKFPLNETPGDPTGGCMGPCGFDSYDTLKEECIFDCSCMREVLESHCFKKCSPSAKESLLESKEDACRAEAASDDLPTPEEDEEEIMIDDEL